jgi:hypothetical protein
MKKRKKTQVGYHKVKKTPPTKKRKKRISKIRHPLITKYQAVLDAAWRKAVYLAGGGKCFISGETKMVNAHHIIDRRCYTSRWVVGVGILLSPSYHKFGSKSIHNNPLFVLRKLRDTDEVRFLNLALLVDGARFIGEMTMNEQLHIVLEALRTLRPDLYAKEIPF